MNKRIRLIAEEAEFSEVDLQIQGDNFQRLAELIVQECVRYFNEDYQRDFDALWREDLSKGMKEHFGVEE